MGTLNRILTISLLALGVGLFSAGCGDNIPCRSEKNCLPEQSCVDGRCIEDKVVDVIDVVGERSCEPEVLVCFEGNVHSRDSCYNLGELVKECEDECNEGRCVECNPYTFNNVCEDSVLTYCDRDYWKLRQIDCQRAGFEHCDYVGIVGNQICFGDGGVGSPCPSEARVLYGDPRLIVSECNYYEVDACFARPFSGQGFCTVECSKDEDCAGYGPGEDPNCLQGYCVPWSF